jgi:hypothetical protein
VRCALAAASERKRATARSAVHDADEHSGAQRWRAHTTQLAKHAKCAAPCAQRRGRGQGRVGEARLRQSSYNHPHHACPPIAW